MDTHTAGNVKHGGDRKVFGLLLVIALFLGVFVCFVKMPASGDAGFNDEETRIITDKFQVTIGNREAFASSLPIEIDASAGEKIVLTRTLADGELFGNAMLFYCKQADVSVFFDGELMTANESHQNTPFPMTPGSRWYFWRMPAEYAGKELRIEITYALDEYASALPAIYTGNKAAFVYMLAGKAKASLWTCIPIITLGALMLISGMLMESRKIAKRMCRLGTLAVVISGWMLLESQITQLFTDNLSAAAYILFSFYYMIPVFVTAFFLTYESISRKKYMHVLFWLAVGAYVAVLGLQVFGITYYMNLIWVVHVQIILIAVGILGCYIGWIRDGRKEKNDESIYAAIVFLGAFAGIDILRFYLYPAESVGRYSRVGLIVFLGYLGFYAVKQVGELRVQEAKENLYRELAYTDMMTGLANRSAFEQKMEEIRQMEKAESVIVLIADVNNLKRINDNFGHPSGDDAIISTAHTLKKIFGEECRCYRIGGDEFCVIAQNMDEKVFAEKYRKFGEQIGIYGHEKIYPFAVATGYKVVKDNDVDACLKQADLLMYEIKALMKKTENAGKA